MTALRHTATARPICDPSVVVAGFLRRLGVPVTTWRAFSCDRVDAAVEARFGLTGKRRLSGVGITLPTGDLRQPDQILGLVRLLGGQQKHRFATPPVGLAAAADAPTAARRICTDQPVLALRLHAAGAAGVVLAEDPAVLPAMSDALADRPLTLVARCSAELSALRAACGALGDRAEGIIVPMVPEHWSGAVRRTLGLPPPAEPAPPPEPTPVMLTDVHRSWTRCLEQDAAQAALRTFDLTDPDLIRAYGIAFAPVEFRAALPPDVLAALGSRIRGNSLILPAREVSGAVVDHLAVSVSNGFVTPSLFPEPRGMLGSPLATCAETVVVTDCVRHLGRLWSTHLPPLLLRGPQDAARIAPRLRTSGVRRVVVRVTRHAHAEAIGSALRAAGIDVEVPEPARRRLAPLPTEPLVPGLPVVADIAAATPSPSSSITMEEAAPPTSPPVPVPDAGVAQVPDGAPAPVPASAPPACPPPADVPRRSVTLLTYDAHLERAVCVYAGITLTVQVPTDTATSVEVTANVGPRRHRSRVNLARLDACHRFAIVGAARIGVPLTDLRDALPLLLPVIQRLGQRTSAPAPSTTATTATPGPHDAAAMELLRDADLLGRWTAACTDLGWIGDAETKAIAILTAISRFAPDPVWTALSAMHPAERFPGIAAIAALTPPEHRIHVARLTDQALTNTAADALAHRLLILDDLATVTPPVATALKVLRTHGSLTATRVERDVAGEMRTRFVTTPGPVAVLGATVGAVPRSLSQHLVEAPVDESPEQVAQRWQARRTHLGGTPPVDPQVIAVFHAAQRLLQPLPVILPPEVAVDLPTVVRVNRVFHEAVYGLIAAHALLHQCQRPRLDGAVAAMAADVACAVRLVTALAVTASAGVGRGAARLLAAMQASGGDQFTMADLAALMPGWCRWTIRCAVDDLLAVDFLTASPGGRGTARTYTLVGTPPAAGELASLARVGFPHRANSKPRSSHG